MLVKIESVVRFVADIHAAAAWYAKLLDVPVQYENDQYAFVNTGTMNIGFHPVDAKCPGGVGGTTVYWEVFNIDKTIEKFSDLGAIVYRGPIETSLGAKAAMLLDPFGCTIGLNQVQQS